MVSVYYLTPSRLTGGVAQGNMTPPLYFTLTLELILKRHDTHSNKGVNFGSLRVDVLVHADDAALLNVDLSVTTARVTAIEKGSREDADVSMSIDETEVMHVCEKGEVSVTTSTEAKEICKHECKHAG